MRESIDEGDTLLQTQVRPCLTIPNVWTGGHYELKLCLGSPSETSIRAALQAIWQGPSIEGPFANRDREPSSQPIVPADTAHDHLFGVLRIRGVRIPCGTFVVREEDVTGRRQTDFISFYSPLSALSLVFPIGSYPFGSYDAARDWRSELDDWFLQLLRQQRGAFSFEIGATGFEVDLTAASVATLTTGGIPIERFDGILLPGDDDIAWYPPTRFDLIRLA
jgi:hypothetical protein